MKQVIKMLSSLLLILVGGGAVAANLPSGFSESIVASGLSNPTSMEFAPDGRLFICQQAGQLRVLKNGTLLTTPFLTVTTDSSGERGLLGIAFDPNFVNNQLVYIYYTVPGTTAHNRISRFTASGDVALTLLTQPGGLNLTFDGNTVATPLMVESVVGTTHTLGAPSSERVNKTNYRFVSWPDGGAQTHTITTPAVDATYTAVYQRKGR
jgi:hypothetical protein